MFSKLAVVSSLVLLAVATPTPGGGGGGPPPPPPTIPASQCNTGDLQCCNSAQAATASGIAGLLAIVGVLVGDVTGLVGVTCSPLSIIAGGGNSCTAQPVCCTNNSFDGFVAIGCSPVNVNL